MNKEVISNETKKFLLISTSILVLGCILIYQLICTIKITSINSNDNNVSIVYNITE